MSRSLHLNRWSRALNRARMLWMTSLVAGCASSVEAVIFMASADPEYNASAPSGVLTNSGWEYQGSWGGFLGTPIGSNCFITAGHIGGTIGGLFRFRGVDYQTTAFFDDPNSDLRIWRVCGRFPAYAELYTSGNELNKNAVVFGRGTQRGDAVEGIRVLGGTEVKGWHWGGSDGRRRWGENRVNAVVNGDEVLSQPGTGSLLKFTFDADGGANEAHLSTGDSGGAVFIREGSTWKLAGINYAVDGPYNTNSTGDGFLAAIFDSGGLYTKSGDLWTQSPDLPLDVPGAFYATRISSNVDWINSVLASPVPEDQPVLQAATSLTGTFTDASNVTVNATLHTLRIPAPGAARFYRLRGCAPHRIRAITLRDGVLEISYE